MHLAQAACIQHTHSFIGCVTRAPSPRLQNFEKHTHDEELNLQEVKVMLNTTFGQVRELEMENEKLRARLEGAGNKDQLSEASTSAACLPW